MGWGRAEGVKTISSQGRDRMCLQVMQFPRKYLVMHGFSRGHDNQGESAEILSPARPSVRASE